jgi:K+-transporting ATPase ATPase A chain
MHDSFTPLGGMGPLLNMLLGELVFGGLGTGIYSIILMALVPIFLTGLMIGRTPEFLGKKIVPCENNLIMLYTLAVPISILPLTAIAVLTKVGWPAWPSTRAPTGLPRYSLRTPRLSPTTARISPSSMPTRFSTT